MKQVKKPSALRIAQGTWARSNVKKAQAFAEHLAKVFSHFSKRMNPQRRKHLYNFWRPLPNRNTNQPNSLTLRCRQVTTSSLVKFLMKELPIIRIKYLTQLSSAVFMKGYFPAQWKAAHIIPS
jgi:hypothetical protein